jgi:DNA-binding NarL/FixJ family response regulator
MREAVAAGARLTVLKDADPLQLISAVRSVAGSDNSESRPMGVTSEAKLASNDE